MCVGVCREHMVGRRVPIDTMIICIDKYMCCHCSLFIEARKPRNAKRSVATIRKIHGHVCACVCVSVYIYICIYICSNQSTTFTVYVMSHTQHTGGDRW